MFLFDIIRRWVVTIFIILGIAYAAGVKMPWLDDYTARFLNSSSAIFDNANQVLHENFKDIFDKIEKLKQDLNKEKAE